MKISSVDVMLLPEETPTFTNSRPVLCRVNTDEGIYGLGEAGTTFFVGSDSVFAMIKELTPLILGMDPMNNEVIWNKVYTTAYWTKGNGAIIFAALSALDTALWDIKGKALNKPVYELLGGKFRDKLRCYASQLQFGFYDTFRPQFTVDDFRRVAEIAMEKGYDAVKIDPLVTGIAPGAPRLTANDTFSYFSHQTLNVVEERIGVTREVIGPNSDLIVELHCTTNLQTAIQVAKRIEKYDIMYIEEPIEPLTPSATKALADAVSIPLTNGERTYLRSGFLPYLQDRSLSMIQPDMGICGGMTEMKKICDMAYTFDVGVQAHVCGTPISVAAGVQLEAAIPNFTIHETHVSSVQPGFRSIGEYDDFVPVNGYITVPDRPGIGQDLSKDVMNRFVIETVK